LHSFLIKPFLSHILFSFLVVLSTKFSCNFKIILCNVLIHIYHNLFRIFLPPWLLFILTLLMIFGFFIELLKYFLTFWSSNFNLSEVSAIFNKYYEAFLYLIKKVVAYSVTVFLPQLYNLILHLHYHFKIICWQFLQRQFFFMINKLLFLFLFKGFS
jgi:hypothetical protein